jgi:hypothetical protein
MGDLALFQRIHPLQQSTVIHQKTPHGDKGVDDMIAIDPQFSSVNSTSVKKTEHHE